MTSTIHITFLGTSSSIPTLSRNNSSLGIKFDSIGKIWLFDCGESTRHQIMKYNTINHLKNLPLQTEKFFNVDPIHYKTSRIDKIFITHSHGDHCFGLPGIISTICGSGNSSILDIYGPSGLRLWIRNTLRFTFAKLKTKYRVHELLHSYDDNDISLDLLDYELSGKNIIPDGGIWTCIDDTECGISVQAGEIKHTVDCFGYVLKEIKGALKSDYILDILNKQEIDVKQRDVIKLLKNNSNFTCPDGTVLIPKNCFERGRKIVILGDTYDPFSLSYIAMDCDVLIHECTNAALPSLKEDTKNVELLAKSRGHSTPQMAGIFAKSINAKVLLLNHFSNRYSRERYIMDEIKDLVDFEKCCTVEDFMTFKFI
jgi:ribonuclease Z